MKDLLDKLSSYNLFNYLLPGTIFVAGAERLTTYRFDNGNILVSFFIYYFVGLVISRVGSLAIEPALKNFRFVEFAPYRDFVRACAKDAKIDVLSEQNNSYRTLCALFLALPLFKILDLAIARAGISPEVGLLLLFAALFILFLFAYRKQTRYVKQRVEANTE